MPGPCLLLQTPADWADAVASLPVAGALPVRTVLVPCERHAHALRRALARSGRGSALAGTRFCGAATLAFELLREAGRDLRAGEEALRPARLQALLAEALPLEHFQLELLRATPGWPEALAAAIGDLEGAGLSPDRLPTSSGQWRDLALLWRRLDAAAGPSVTAARAYREAAALLSTGSHPAAGPVLAAVTGRETACQARFVAALPGVTIALQVARPRRTRHLERVEALFGPDARAALESAAPPTAAGTERELVSRYLFASPAALAEPARPRSTGPDGTVELSEHAGVEAEIEAAADWVAREIAEHRTPLEEIAVLFPVADPLAGLVAARLARIPFAGGPLPVHVAGGLPATSRAGGTRALALLRALGTFLPAEQLAALLPGLRAASETRTHLSHGEAAELAWSLGTVGGNAAAPGQALEWSTRLVAAEARLAAQVEALGANPVADDREGRELRRRLEVVRAARPALAALCQLARLVVEDQPLAVLAPALAGFMESFLLEPWGEPTVRALLASALESARSDAVGDLVRGVGALDVVEERLLALRLPTARFGSPAIFVGTVAAAAGLPFSAVRVLGLSEGALPSSAREDAILPDRMREAADRLLVPISADRVLAQLHAFDRVVRGAGRSLAFSSPRSDLERSEREASSLLVDVGAALGRPDPVRPGAVIPDLASLQRTAFAPARAAAAAFTESFPLGEPCWQARAALRGEIPPSWSGAAHLDLDRLIALRTPVGLGPWDGLLGRKGPFPPLPGLDPTRPTSASALGALMACPLHFLYERFLQWDAPAGAPSLRELDALTYGTLFHEVMEWFYQAHGQPFVARERSLPHWRTLALAIADERFAARRAEYPLVGLGVAEKERSRLRREVGRFLAYDWSLQLDRFVAVERAFGTPEPLVLQVGGAALHVRGFVDRIDVEKGHTLLRDLKTGRDHPRTGDEEGPNPGRDLQLGLYGLVARQLAAEWGIPRRLQVAYAYARNGQERAFRSDYPDLEAAASGWLAVAVGLLSAHAFPPTPFVEDCTWCSFSPVCGGEVPARAAGALDARGAVSAYLTLRGGDE